MAGRKRRQALKVESFYGVTLRGADEFWMPPAQNSISSICWYHGAELLNIDRRPSPSEFRAALEAAGVENTKSRVTPWQVELPGGVVRMVVKESIDTVYE